MKIDNDILIQNKIYEHSKLVLLADELNFDQTFGVTKSILKIRRNLHVIGFDLNNEFEKELANAQHELICIWQRPRTTGAGFRKKCSGKWIGSFAAVADW